MNRGRALTLLMLGMGIVATACAVWFNSRQAERIMSALTPGVADAIAHASHAELMTVDDVIDSTERERTKIQGRAYVVTGYRNLDGARGYINFRAALLRDASYDWSVSVDQGSDDWEYLVIFANGKKSVRLAFDLAGKRMALPDGGPVLSIAPIADGLAAFFAEHSAEGGSAP